MSRLKAFERQQALRERLASRPRLYETVAPEQVDRLLDQPVDEARLAALDYGSDLAVALAAPPRDAHILLAELEAAFDGGRVDELLQKTRTDILQSIAGPFGLGKILSALDKDGGNVDTIHNARNCIYASDRERQAYEKRGEYNDKTKPYSERVKNQVHTDERYIEENERIAINRVSHGVTDGYAHVTRGAPDKVDQDHVVSGKQTHDDPGRVLAEVSTRDAANLAENRIATDPSINRSKGAKDPEEFARYLEDMAPQRRERIAELAAREELSDQERKELNKLEKLEQADPNAIREHGKAAHAAQDRQYNEAYYTSRKFIGDTLGTSGIEGTRMGTQQAFGILLMEFFDGVVWEARDAFRNGLQGDSLFADLKMRLKRVAAAVAARWKDAIKGFGEGFISGFLSNIVTTIINMLVTTGARAVRMIREGVFSLLKAIKMALFPPPGMTLREACHEGMKLLAAGGIVIAGVALEEIVEKFIASVPVLSLIAPVLTAVVVGSLTALGMALSAYLIDRLDLLGVIRKQRDAHVLGSLDQNITQILESCRRLEDEVDALVAVT